MPTSDYAAIRAENIIEYGRGTKHLEFFRDLYGDRTHFILELLQNAEDARATFVHFELRPDRLIVEHDGRLFTPEDVRGISGVGIGTKQDDLTTIGRFGIGFKSVFRYTDHPHIYSGGERFAIERFVRPHEVPPIRLPDGQTRIEIPFDREAVPATTAHDEIQRGLEHLPSTVVLFLANVRRLNIATGNADRSIERIPRSAPTGAVSLIDRSDRDAENSDWLVFGKPLQSRQAPNLKLEIAFRLEDGRVSALTRSPLVAYFPTEKDTRLKFLVQGPYRTTPARDNVPESDDWNQSLVHETAALLSDSLPKVQKLGLLDAEALSALPIEEEDFEEGTVFRPLFEAVKRCLRTSALIPTDDGGFAPASQVKLGRTAAIRGLLSRKQLGEVFASKNPVRWVDGQITQNAHPILWRYLRQHLDIEELTAELLASKLTTSFLQRQSDSWIIRLYTFFGEQRALLRGSALYDLKLVRLENGTHVRPFKEDGDQNAYLPVDRATEFPTVRRSIVRNEEAREFLEDLGIGEPDAVDEVVRYVIPRYQTAAKRSKVDQSTNQRDVRLIVNLLATGSRSQRDRLKTSVESVPFLRGKRDSPNSPMVYGIGTDIYLHSPLLDVLFGGNPEVLWLDQTYDLSPGEAALLGVADSPRVKAKQPDNRGYVVLRDYPKDHARGVDGFDPTAQMDGLEFILDNIDVHRARALWNLLAARPALVAGRIERATRKSYDNAEVSTVPSDAGKLLRSYAWLPRADEFRSPGEVSLDDLPDGFARSHDLADVLGMRSTVIDELARERGMSADTLQWILDHPELAERLRQRAERERPRSDAPEREEGSRRDHAIAPEANRDEDHQSTGATESRPKAERGERSESTGTEKRDPPWESGSPESEAGGDDRSRAGGGEGSPVSSGNGKGTATQGRGDDPRVTYVKHEEQQPRDGSGMEAVRTQVERDGIRRVLAFETADGRTPEEMPPNNPGYDIKSAGADGRTRYIEVKALSGAWGRYGVSLTATEYLAAQRLQDQYWLYVVENTNSSTPSLARIQNPAALINQYVFDRGWLGLADVDEEIATE